MAQINPLLLASVATADPTGSFSKGLQSTQAAKLNQEAIRQQKTKTTSAEQKGQLQTAVLKGIELEKVLSQADSQIAQQQALESLDRDIAEAEGAGRSADNVKRLRQQVATGDISGAITGLQRDREQAKAFGIGEEALSARTAAGGGATGALAKQLIDEGSAKNVEEALFLIKGGAGRGLTVDPTGTVISRTGVAEAQAGIAGKKTEAVKAAELKFTEQIESAKLKGSGKTAENELQRRAREKTSSSVAFLREQFNNLKDIGAIVDDTEPFAENIKRSVEASSIGQFIGRISGDKAQTIRKNIDDAKPGLLLDLMNSSGASARALDSDAELKIWLRTTGDTKSSIQSNLAMLKRIDNFMKISGGKEDRQTTQPKTRKLFNPTTGEFE